MAMTGKLGRLGATALALAGMTAGAVLVAAPAFAQAPSSVPTARFYGHATFPNGVLPAGTSVTATVGGVACSVSVSATGGVSTGSLDNLGNYALDIQAVPGCTTPGGTVTFSSSGLRAKETGTIPQIPGTAVHLDLTFAPAATATPAPPPPPSVAPSASPSPRPTTAPPPPPPPATATPRPSATPAPHPVTQQAPRGPVVAQAPKGPVAAQGPKAAAYGQGGYVAATAPRLPSTGTGGLLDAQSSSSSVTGWALAAIVLAALGISASGLVAYRRSR